MYCPTASGSCNVKVTQRHMTIREVLPAENFNLKLGPLGSQIESSKQEWTEGQIAKVAGLMFPAQ